MGRTASTPMLATIAVALLLAGCGDPSAQTGPAMAPEDASAAHTANPVVAVVSGGGNYFAPDRRTFAFTARRHLDGTVHGQWERIRRQDGNASDSKSHGVVTCFTRVGNEFWLGGYATSGTFSEPPFHEVAWRAADNGQGGNAAPDQLSLQFVGAGPGFAAAYCADTPPDPALIPLTSGNITSR